MLYLPPLGHLDPPATGFVYVRWQGWKKLRGAETNTTHQQTDRYSLVDTLDFSSVQLGSLT
jgi:hypothetical protein